MPYATMSSSLKGVCARLAIVAGSGTTLRTSLLWQLSEAGLLRMFCGKVGRAQVVAFSFFPTNLGPLNEKKRELSC